MTEQTNDTNPQKTSSNAFFKQLKSWLPYILIPLVVYFGNVELQTYLGKKALEDLNIPKLSLEEALTQAKRENKLVLADMSAIWCPSCRKLDQEVLSNTKVQTAIEQHFVFSRIEYESEAGKAFMAKYDVSAFPTLLILDANGQKVRKLPLTFSPEQFIAYLGQI